MYYDVQTKKVVCWNMQSVSTLGVSPAEDRFSLDDGNLSSDFFFLRNIALPLVARGAAWRWMVYGWVLEW